jgi:hypothetical protein
MNADKALANCGIHRISEGGDTGRGWAERMSFSQLRFTLKSETGLSLVIALLSNELQSDENHSITIVPCLRP